MSDVSFNYQYVRKGSAFRPEMVKAKRAHLKKSPGKTLGDMMS